MMQKISITSILLLTAIIAQTAPSFISIESTITGIHTKLFGVENLYEKPLIAREWHDVIASAYEFVKEKHDQVEALDDTRQKGYFSNLTSSTLKRNKELLKHYEKIKMASDDLIKTIHNAFSNVIQLTDIGDPTPKNSKLIAPFVKKFESISKSMDSLHAYLQKDLKTLKDKIKSEKSDTKKKMLKEQEQAVAVLNRLALTIATTAAKAARDLKK
jgi:hypothetical protein